MKVRPCVKKICEKCKVIRRHGAVHGHLHEPPAQAAPGLGAGAGMARISGVDIPREKRLEISLTYIFGIGRTDRASRSATATGIVARHPGAGPDRGRGRRAPRRSSTPT